MYGEGEPRKAGATTCTCCDNDIEPGSYQYDRGYLCSDCETRIREFAPWVMEKLTVADLIVLIDLLDSTISHFAKVKEAKVTTHTRKLAGVV